MNNLKQKAWAAYDGINSVVHLILITILLPWVFDDFSRSYGYESILGWSAITATSLLLVGFFAIFFSNFLDKPRIRFVFFVVINILVASLAFYISVSMQIDFFLLPVASIALLFFFNIALFIYDSYLIDAEHHNKYKPEFDINSLTTLSGKAWSFGYLVSGVVLSYFWWSFVRDSSITQDTLTHMISCSAIIFAVGATLLLALWPGELVIKTKTSKISFFSILFSRGILENKIRKFLLFAFLLQDGATTLSFFVTLIAKNAYGLTLAQTIELFLIVHAFGIFSTWNIGKLLKLFGIKRFLVLIVVGWIISVVLASVSIAIFNNKYILYVMSAIIGLLIGTTPALLRSLYTMIIPIDQRTSFFGYGVVFQRTFSFVGPGIVLLISSITKSYHYVALSGLLLFVPALFMLLMEKDPDFLRINEKGGI
jgi:UMF1 family MFS transporter